METGLGSINVSAQVRSGHQVDDRPVLPSLGLEHASRKELVSRLRTELVAGGLEALKIESVRSMGYRLALPD